MQRTALSWRTGSRVPTFRKVFRIEWISSRNHVIQVSGIKLVGRSWILDQSGDWIHIPLQNVEEEIVVIDQSWSQRDLLEVEHSSRKAEERCKDQLPELQVGHSRRACEAGFQSAGG